MGSLWLPPTLVSLRALCSVGFWTPGSPLNTEKGQLTRPSTLYAGVKQRIRGTDLFLKNDFSIFILLCPSRLFLMFKVIVYHLRSIFTFTTTLGSAGSHANGRQGPGCSKARGLGLRASGAEKRIRSSMALRWLSEKI